MFTGSELILKKCELNKISTYKNTPDSIDKLYDDVERIFSLNFREEYF